MPTLECYGIINLQTDKAQYAMHYEKTRHKLEMHHVRTSCVRNYIVKDFPA